MPAFSNPCLGTITPKGTTRPAGTFGVTSTFADHVASGRAPGVDIGNGGCGAAVLAMTTGTVSLVRLGKPGSTASIDSSIVRIKRPDGWEVGVAHLAVKAGLAVGQSIAEGAPVGACDKIGAGACHIHFGAKDPSGKEVDPWPLLKQNGATEEEGMDPSFDPKPNRTVTVNKGARHRLAPTTADPSNIAIASDPGGPLGFPLMGTVVGQAVNGNAIWYAYWRPDIPVPTVYYLHTSTCGPETPWEDTSGHSDADLIAAAKLARENGIADAAKAAGAVV